MPSDAIFSASLLPDIISCIKINIVASVTKIQRYEKMRNNITGKANNLNCFIFLQSEQRAIKIKIIRKA